MAKGWSPLRTEAQLSTRDGAADMLAGLAERRAQPLGSAKRGFVTVGFYSGGSQTRPRETRSMEIGAAPFDAEVEAPVCRRRTRRRQTSTARRIRA